MKKSWIIGVLCVIGYCLILKYMFDVVFPFGLAIVCYFIMKPLIDSLEHHFDIQRSAIGVSLLLTIYLVLALILGGIMTYGIFFFIDFFRNIPMYYQDMFLPWLNEFLLWLEQQFPFLVNQNSLTSLQEFLTQSLLRIVTSFSTILAHIPMYLFSFFLFVISTFFLMLDYDDMKEKLLSLCHYRWIQSFVDIKNRCLHCLWIYLKCQLILMGICFVILFFGFCILRLKYPFLYAFMTALLDSLPFIGVGIVLMPLCVVYLFQKAYLRAFYIFLIYLIINVIRSLLEPHIMNKQMKIPSFLLLMSMMIHLHFFGMIGVILSPIHMSLFYSFLDHSSQR